MSIKTPTIHLNGTSKQELLDQYLNVLKALKAASDALCEAAPHGRDYYPQGDAVIITATNEHCVRIRKLAEIEVEIRQIAEAIA
jgi:hypothetical protein